MDLEEKFDRYHNDNPHVYTLLYQFANLAYETELTKYSINALFERLRWHLNIDTKGDIFKLNNNHRAFYSRMLMKEYPKFKTFFKTREQRFKK